MSTAPVADFATAEISWLSLQWPGESLAVAESWLSHDERHRLSSMSPSIRCQFVAVRSILRHLLGSRLGCSPKDVLFRYGLHGKPCLAESHGRGPAFSVTHSGCWAGIALADVQHVGLDIERVNPDAEHDLLAEAVFSTGELAAYRTLTEGRRRAAFYRAWVIKEAFVKAVGRGLSEGLHDVEVHHEPSGPASLVAVPIAYRGFQWQLTELALDEDIVGACVASAGKLEVRQRWLERMEIQEALGLG